LWGALTVTLQKFGQYFYRFVAAMRVAFARFLKKVGELHHPNYEDR
jgi:hypothetical protein